MSDKAPQTDRERIATGSVNESIVRVETQYQGTISRIVPSQAELAAGALGTETIERASRCFRTDGALIVEDIVDTAIIVEARRAFHQAYSHYLDGSKREDALLVGERRLLITIRLD